MADRFWELVESLSKGKPDMILKELTTHELLSHRKERLERLRDLASWDQWAVGCLFGGSTDPSYMLPYARWVIAQGEAFYRSVLADPRHAVTRISDDPPFYKLDDGGVVNALNAILEERLQGPRDQEEEFKTESPRGRPWHWRELKDIHPDLWERFFVNKDRRLPHLPPPGGKEADFAFVTASPLMEWVDFYHDPDYLVAQYAVLSPDQAGLHAVWWCYLECQNGGMDQFFHNSAGAVAPEALEGFLRFGAQEHHVDLKTIMDAFPWGAPSRDRKTRQAQRTQRWPHGTIDDEFAGGSLPELEPILAAYIQAHPLSFYRKA